MLDKLYWAGERHRLPSPFRCDSLAGRRSSRQANGARPQEDDNTTTEPPGDAPDAEPVYTCVLAETEVVVLLTPPNKRDRLAK
jgi:hypothetical protein